MKQQKDLIVRVWPFFMVFAIFMVLGLGLHAYFGKAELHYFGNQFYSDFTDSFFKYYTHFGDFIAVIVVLIFILWKKTWRYILLLLSAEIFQAILVQLIKRPLFIDHVRPKLYMERLDYHLHLVDGVSQRITFTFPSGHTATAFCLGLFLCLLTKNRWWQFAFAFMSVLVAVSRVYLSQHFVLDTVTGSFIGTSSLVLFYYLTFQRNWNFMDKKVSALF